VIIRQTGDLRRIVDEFSKFARMPEPETRIRDIAVLVRDAVTLQDAADETIRLDAHIPDMAVLVEIDETMIGQALTNLIKNAGEAIETLRKNGDAPQDHQAIVRVELTTDDLATRIIIEDNGVGLPPDRARLFEPYVTTRDEGTGLGLPIVKKIIEEHGGTLTLSDADALDASGQIGARATITLPPPVARNEAADAEVA